MTFQDIARLVRDRAPGKLLITGEDRFLGYSLMCGARAALIGMAAACTGLQAELLRAYRDGDAARFLSLSRRGRRPGPAYVPRPDGRLHPAHALVPGRIQGVIPMDAAHDPWGPPLDPAEFDRLGGRASRGCRPGARRHREPSNGRSSGNADESMLRPHLLPRTPDVPGRLIGRVRSRPRPVRRRGTARGPRGLSPASPTAWT